MKNRIKPLYRKVNTKARGVTHFFGDDFKNSRKSKSHSSMKKGVERGLDYTPLFKFLISKVGSSWDGIYKEAISRLDKNDPIFWIVSKSEEQALEYVCVGESSYYSGLYIDKTGVLQITNPEIDESSMKPFCKCCTHTFNGIVFINKFE